MNPLESSLLELLAIAESPLYSAYRTIGRSLGSDVALSEFLRSVGELLERDILRLWLVDAPSGDQTELFQIPIDLESRYVESGHSDPTFDPFSLSLTLGTNAVVGVAPDWEVDLRFEEGTFELRAKRDESEEALRQLAKYYPDSRLEAQRTIEQGDQVLVRGKIVRPWQR